MTNAVFSQLEASIRAAILAGCTPLQVMSATVKILKKLTEAKGG